MIRPPKDGSHATATTRSSGGAAWAVAGVGLAAGLAVWFSTWTMPPGGGAWAFGRVFLASAPWALGWIVAAWGLGRAATGGGAVLGAERVSFSIEISIGVAILLVLDAGLGALGVLAFGGSLGAWAVVGFGWALAGLGVARGRAKDAAPSPDVALLARHGWVWVAIAPAAAVLAVAACSSPGGLWATEFGGYDALAYHLQLPREWLALGRAMPLEHNVYSFLPGYVEAAYLHLAILRGDAVAAAPAAQLLHAGITLLAGLATADLLRRHASGLAAAAAGVLLVGTPWAVVVGSLAYNEMFLVLFLAAALSVATEGRTGAAGAAAIGLLAAAACGAKLTAAGFVVLPLVLALVTSVPPRRWLTVLPIAAGAGFLGLGPYLLRNEFHAGNPVFPFLPEVFGFGHWTAEQFDAWERGHFAETGVLGRVGALWDRYLRFGFGANPDPGEPWRAQWSILPWLGLAGLVGATALFRGERARFARRMGIVWGAQVVFWLAATHLKSRFLVPTLAPAAALAGLAVDAAFKGSRMDAGAPRPGRAEAGVAALLLLWCAQPVAIFRGEGMTGAGATPAAWIGMSGALEGDDPPPGVTAEDLSATFASAAVNLLPPGSRVLLLGVADPFYFDPARVAYATTYDRGPLSRAMRAQPDDPAAWTAALRERGFTHALVNFEMIDLWDREDRADPLLSVERVRRWLRSGASPARAFAPHLVLFRLKPAEPLERSRGEEALELESVELALEALDRREQLGRAILGGEGVPGGDEDLQRAAEVGEPLVQIARLVRRGAGEGLGFVE